MNQSVELRGAARELFRSWEPEILLEGPAGTGKSRAVCERLHYYAETYPKCRMLMARKTRARMGQSVLVTFEEHVVPEGHPCLSNVSRAYRESYKYPNGSEIVVGGMDDPTRVMSTDYDVVVAFEATEFTLDDWERMITRLRNHRIPHPTKPGKFMEQAIADCNPGSEFHWLNQRARAGKMKRLLSRHEDNPTVTEEYLEKLRGLTGPRRSRLFEGLWVSMTGQIWENFLPSVHVVDAQLKMIDSRWRIVDEDGVILGYVSYFMAACDWGFAAPGTLLVAAIDVEGAAWIVHELYMTGKDINWWADAAERMRKKYDIQWYCCDPSRPENIAVFNKRMGRAGGYQIASEVDIAGGANNAIQAGLSVVRERWAAEKLFVLKGALEMRDPELDEDDQPCGLVEEIPSYVYAETKDGRPIEEGPDPGCADHSCDALRYLCMYLDSNDWREADGPKDSGYPPGSYGDVLGHAEVFEPDLDWIDEWA